MEENKLRHICPKFSENASLYENMKLRRIEVFDIRLNIVLSVVLSFESVHFQQDDLLDAVRLICAAQPGFSASSTTYV